MFRQSARWLARRELLPTSVRAVVGYYGASGVFDYGSLAVKRRVDRTVEEMIDDAFVDVEEAIAEEFGYGYVSFEYDTKLLLPAKLALGYLYRRLEDDSRERAGELTGLIADALIDGDMRDAINDDEYEGFEVDFNVEPDQRKRIAEIAQEVLQTRVTAGFDEFPDEVRTAYENAVEDSKSHQEEDPYFRELMTEARQGDETALERIETEYKYGDLKTLPDVFTRDDRQLPYLKTQYERVGVIYKGMIGMYRGAGFSVEDAFERAIVLAIIGAQIWLDDIDDYAVDSRNGQLTPVTAEYLLAESPAEARESVIKIGHTYLRRAKRQATVADSPLTGIAAEYILRDGSPELLPGERS